MYSPLFQPWTSRCTQLLPLSHKQCRTICCGLGGECPWPGCSDIILSIRARCHFFSFLLTASIFSSTASAVYQRDLGRLNVGKEAGGSQPALKRALSFQAPSSLALSPFCKNLWCPYHLQEKLWCLSLKSKSGGRWRKKLEKDSRGTLIKTQEEKFRSRKVWGATKVQRRRT